MTPPAIGDDEKGGVKLTMNDVIQLGINESVLDRDAIYADYKLEPVILASSWRIIPIIIYLLTMGTSMIWIVAFGAAQNDFRGFCLLFGRLKYSLGVHYKINKMISSSDKLSDSNTPQKDLDEDYTSILTGHYEDFNATNPNAMSGGGRYNDTSIASVDYINTLWGPGCMCNFCLYLAVASLFYAFLCCMFFSLCQIGRTQYAMLEHPSRLVLPSLLLSFVFSLLTVVAAWLITKGLDHWCLGIEEGPLLRCQDVVSLTWINNAKHIMNPYRKGSFYSFFRVTKIASWMTAVFWVSCTMLLMTRFFGAADFQKPKISKFPPDSNTLKFSDSDYSLRPIEQEYSSDMHDPNTPNNNLNEEDETRFITHTPEETYKIPRNVEAKLDAKTKL